MRRMDAFTILFLTFSFLHSALTVPTVTSLLPLELDKTISPSHGNFTELLMEQNTGQPSSNIKSFIQMVWNASLAVQKDVELLEKQVSPHAGSEFNYSVAILKKSSTEVLSLASNIIKKLELAETERIIRLFASKSLGIENQTTYTFWLKNKASQIMEDVLHLKMHYTELSELYEAQLIGSILFKEDGANHEDEEEPLAFTTESGARNVTCKTFWNGSIHCDDGTETKPSESPDATTEGLIRRSGWNRKTPRRFYHIGPQSIPAGLNLS